MERWCAAAADWMRRGLGGRHPRVFSEICRLRFMGRFGRRWIQRRSLGIEVRIRWIRHGGLRRLFGKHRWMSKQGADFVMVKPGMPYLDVLAAVRQKVVQVPVVAYQVSGEYSMLESAARQGWLDRDAAVVESLLAFSGGGEFDYQLFSDVAVRIFSP